MRCNKVAEIGTDLQYVGVRASKEKKDKTLDEVALSCAWQKLSDPPPMWVHNQHPLTEWSLDVFPVHV